MRGALGLGGLARGLGGLRAVSPRVVASGAISRPSFTTNFAADEEPISDGGRFYKTTDMNLWEPVKTLSGRCYGTNGPDDAFDDAYAMIARATGDYELIGTIYRDAALNTGAPHEIELNFNFKEVSGGVRGFECLFSFSGSTQAFIWNHPNTGATAGTFTEVTSSGGAVSIGAFSTGSKIRATKIGNTLRAYAWNGSAWTELAAYTDATFTDGEAAIGFFTRPAGNSAHFALTELTVTPL